MVWKDTCTPMVPEALFTIARIQKQAKCPSAEEWIKKTWKYVCWSIVCGCVGVHTHCSVVSSSATVWTVTHQTSLSTEFSRQEHWSGFPFPSPGNLPDPGINPASPALAGGFFTTTAPGAQPLKRMKNAICCNMDRPRDCHTE